MAASVLSYTHNDKAQNSLVCSFEEEEFGSWLDGCDVSLIGLSQSFNNECIEHLLTGGGTRRNGYRPQSTHIISSSYSNAMKEIQLYNNIYQSNISIFTGHIMNQSVLQPIISTQWLRDCSATKQCLPTEKYLLSPWEADQVPLKRQLSNPSNSSQTLDALGRSALKRSSTELIEETASMQYSIFGNTITATAAVKSDSSGSRQISGQTDFAAFNNQLKRSRSNISDTSTTSDNLTRNGNSNSANIPAATVENRKSEGLFDGFTLIIGDISLSLRVRIGAAIQKATGKHYNYTVGDMHPSSFDPSLIDYVICERIDRKLREYFPNDRTRFVKPQYILDCIREKKRLHKRLEHCPLPTDTQEFPAFRGLQFCLSGFAAELKALLGAILAELEARVTEGIEANQTTHCICFAATGEKYWACKEKNIPAVKVEWLIKCLNSLKMEDLGKFLFSAEDEEVAKEKVTRKQRR
jgi:hypothetical protein